MNQGEDVMRYGVSIFTQPTGLTPPHIVRASGLILLATVLGAGVGCTSGDRTLGLESSGTAAALSLPVATVTLRPRSVTLAPGATRQFKAVLKDAAGTVLTGILVTWKSSNPAVATVSSTGLVKAVALGSATISATAQRKIGTAKVTVSNVTSWLWSTGFETTTNSMNLTSGTHKGGSVVRFKGVPHKGLYSLKFTTPARAASRAAAGRRFTFATGVHVAELWFYFPKGMGSNVQLEVALEGWTGTEEHLPGVQWVKQGSVLGWRRYIHPGWTFIPGGQGKTLSEDKWHYLRYEVDYTRKQHRKLTIDNTVFDLTNLPYPVRRLSSARGRHIAVLLWTTAPVARVVHVDDVRVARPQ
jgi:hypothetical protein